ncbi:MAG: hypothetical protein WD061_01565 [Candidatus Saccharimonadales bacterium]
MSKQLIISLSVALAVIAGGAIYYYLPGADDATLARRALEGIGSMTCDFVDEQTGEEATMYISSGDVRVDGVSYGIMEENLEEDAAPPEVPTYMMLKDDQMYVWAEGEDQGIVNSLEAEDGDNSGNLMFENYDDEEAFKEDLDRGDFSCSRGASASLFELPDDVEFVDFQSMFGADMLSEEDLESDSSEGLDGEAISEEELEQLLEDAEGDLE